MRALACAALALLAPALAAQSPRALLRDARQAFLVIELDRARDLAARALAGSGGDTLSSAERSDALMLLGTVAVLSNAEGEAGARFRDLVRHDPLYEPDPRRAPSAALQAYFRVREATKATVLDVPPRQRVGPGEPFRATVGVSSLHDVTVALLAAAGDTVAVLWSGAVRRHQDLAWDGAGAGSGRYVLVSATRERGRVTREVRVPLTITAQVADTTAWPERPLLLPETRPGRSDGRLLATGLGLGAAVLLAPAVARAGSGAPGRVMVAGALSVGGILAFLAGRRSTPIADNAAANRAAVVAWERQRDQVARQNAARSAAPVLDVRAGAAERVER